MENEDTIITDESEETVVVDPRTAAINAIAQKVEREEVEELPEEEPEELSEEPEEEEEDVEEEKVSVKVDGQEMLVDRGKIYDAGVRTFQKETAADKRLKEAADREARLQEREQKLAKMEQELLERNNSEPDEVSKKFVEALFSDEEEAAKEFSKLHRTVQKLSEKVTKQEKTEASKAKRDMDSATNHYHSNYRDIAEDADLHASFNRRLQTLAKDDPTGTPTQWIDKAAEQVYERFGKPETEEKEPTKQEMKEKLVKQPKAASSRRKPPPKEKQETRSDVLAGMRSGRAVQSY